MEPALKCPSNSVGTHNQMKPASTIGAKFSRRSFFPSKLGPPQRRSAALLKKLYFPFFQLLRPSFAVFHQSKPINLGQNMFKTAHQISSSMPPGLVTRTSPCTFHDLPPFSVSSPNCSMPILGCMFPSHMSRPSMHSRQRSVPQRRKVQPAS